MVKSLSPRILHLSAALIALAASNIRASDIADPEPWLLEEIYEDTTTSGPPLGETTLDTSSDINKFWKVSPYRPVIWFAYYGNNADLAADKNSCASQIGNNLANAAGIWVACMDSGLPEGCHADPESMQPCHPFLKYDNGIANRFGLRTLTIKFALFGLALLRLRLKFNGADCFDYSPRQDPFSPCEYTHVTDGSSVTGGWQEIQFTFEPGANISFSIFKVELIARFKGDIALLDGIKGTDKLLCDGGIECIPPSTRFIPTKPTPPVVIVTTQKATTVSEGQPVFSDPDVVITSTPPEHASGAKLAMSGYFIGIITTCFLSHKLYVDNFIDF